MCLLFESIHVQDGNIYNIAYHQQRVDKHSSINLLAYIQKAVCIPSKGRHKLRIAYTENAVKTHSIEVYAPRKIRSLQICIDDTIEYHKKFDDRTRLNALMQHKGECDDILIIKNNLVCDISFANIVFFDGKSWVTPEIPLLEGTCRARLIDQEIIRPKTIHLHDVQSFRKFLIINAMLDFDVQRAVTYSYCERRRCLKA